MGQGCVLMFFFHLFVLWQMSSRDDGSLKGYTVGNHSPMITDVV